MQALARLWGSALPVAAAHRDRNCLHLRSQLSGSVAHSPESSPWVLSGFTSSLDLVYTWKNKATCLTNHPGCKGLSPRRRALRGWLPRISACSSPSQGLRRGWSWWGRQAWGILGSCSPQARGKAATSWAPLDPAGKGRVS